MGWEEITFFPLIVYETMTTTRRDHIFALNSLWLPWEEITCFSLNSLYASLGAMLRFYVNWSEYKKNTTMDIDKSMVTTHEWRCRQEWRSILLCALMLWITYTSMLSKRLNDQTINARRVERELRNRYVVVAGNLLARILSSQLSLRL
jgi:hypothetical protein